MDLAPIHRTSDRLDPVVVEHQIWMPVLMEPILDLVLRLRNCRAHYVLRRRAIRIGRRPRDIFLSP